MKTIGRVYQLLQEYVCCHDLFRAALRNRERLEVLVEQLARVFLPLVVRRKTE